MVENLITKILKNSLMLMEFPMISPARELHNKNGFVERKNRTLQEITRTMINETNMDKHFWEEAVNTTCYIHNKISIKPIISNTSKELWKNLKSNISYFYPFGCSCFMLNTKENLSKFDSKSQKCIMLGYCERSKDYRVYNTET